MVKQYFAAMTFRTSTAAGITSLPMPSPGRTAISNCFISRAFRFLGRRGHTPVASGPAWLDGAAESPQDLVESPGVGCAILDRGAQDRFAFLDRPDGGQFVGEGVPRYRDH